MEAWKPHQQLRNGRFTIEKVISVGSFGETYHAFDNLKNKLAVIKTITRTQKSKLHFEQQQEKFVNEALASARCEHPNIAQVYDVFQENRLWSMVMEYIDGNELGCSINQYGPLSEIEALRYIEQLTLALEYIHAKKLLHRNVKPHNSLLRSISKQAVLINLGLTKESESTEGYVPIEQIDEYQTGDRLAEYTDVYGLAVTLYTLLTGKVPISSLERASNNTLLLSPQEQCNQLISDRVNTAILQKI